MPKTSLKNTKKQPVPTTATIWLVLGTLADTTWRLFVPSVGGTVLGLLADKNFGTTPLFIIIGVSIGFVLSVLLIVMQLKRVKNERL